MTANPPDPLPAQPVHRRPGAPLPPELLAQLVTELRAARAVERRRMRRPWLVALLLAALCAVDLVGGITGPRLVWTGSGGGVGGTDGGMQIAYHVRFQNRGWFPVTLETPMVASDPRVQVHLTEPVHLAPGETGTIQIEGVVTGCTFKPSPEPPAHPYTVRLTARSVTGTHLTPSNAAWDTSLGDLLSDCR